MLERWLLNLGDGMLPMMLLLRLRMFLIELLKYIGILLEYSRNGRIWLILEHVELLLQLLLLLHPLRLLPLLLLRPLRPLLLPPRLHPFALDGS
jgi:hypothetical protein